jgi:hypothetical protein
MDAKLNMAEQATKTAGDEQPGGNQVDSQQLQAQALKLVQLAGDVELAKQAVASLATDESLKSASGDSPDQTSAVPDPNNRFLAALDVFERMISLPVIQGELLDWISNAINAFADVRTVLLDKIKHNHEEVFLRILKHDVDLTSRVESLRAKDNQISGQELRNVDRGLQLVLEKAKAAGKDEAQVSELLSHVSQQAQMFVVAARAQETAIAAWLNEAFNRDLGTSG